MKYKIIIAAAVILAFSVAFIKKNHVIPGAPVTMSIDTTRNYNPDVIKVEGCPTKAGIKQTLCLIDAFKAQLTPQQQQVVQLPYTVSDAKKWNNLPQGMVRAELKAPGLNFGSMTTKQIQYAKALIKALAGPAANEGWDELQQILNADEYLKANGGANSGRYGDNNINIAFLGTPATKGVFEIQYGGHHTAFANTYKDGILVGATPSFRGIEPFEKFVWNGKDNQPLQQEQGAFTAMLNALDEKQLAAAKLDKVYSDILTGPTKDTAFPATPSGIKVGTLSASQKALVLAAITTYAGDVADSGPILKKYTAELNDTYVSYSGTTSMVNRNDYVRIDGPSVWIEYSCQKGAIFAGTHPHSIWRDKKTDYGGNL
ncbi:MAG: DUF3500 domain-containing protein [Mucilaginibacter sp.]